MITTSLSPAAEPWSVESYADNDGFAKRAAPTIAALAKVEFGKRSLALSKCPDTGLPVRTYALEGEEIISPYTGRRYKQGPTSYFGPKERDKDGRIIGFGGDPMKYDLPPATARLLVNPDDPEARAMLSIPGNMRQQYHFAAVNWGRFYPLLAEKMGEDWRREFAYWVSTYREGRRPSDGPREYTPVLGVHDLVGDERYLLGGDTKDGGTENHKTQWRTTGLLYSQILGKDVKVSGYSPAEAERITTKVLRQYMQSNLTVGNGEWDSSSYYPWQIRGFLNLYDFSPKPETRALAKATLDFYIATYGLKVMNGTFIGAQKRGWIAGPEPHGMDLLMWMFAPKSTFAVPDSAATILHQATTKYRPNRVICNIIIKNIPLPFEAQMARPTYHAKDANAFHETFWCDDGLAMGSVAMTMQDNPTQQTIWSLGVRSDKGTLIFGGSQPFFHHPEGHSPYDQVIQKRGALIMLASGTSTVIEDSSRPDQIQRRQHASEQLRPTLKDMPAQERWVNAKLLQESWVYIPREAKEVTEIDGNVLVDAGDAFVAIRPIGKWHTWLEGEMDDAMKKLLAKYRVLVIGIAEPATRGVTHVLPYTGFAIDTGLKKVHKTLDGFASALREKTELKDFTYTSLAGDTIEMRYDHTSLRPGGKINGKQIDWSTWANGGVYDSPCIKIKNGQMTVSDGKETYTLDYRGDEPQWRE